MASRWAIFTLTLREFGGWTTIHGLLHIYQSNNRLRQGFWIILLLAGFCLGLFHTVTTCEKYLANEVTPKLRLLSEKAVFPDVTICNQKPASERLTSWGIFRNYLQTSWGLFTNWYVEDRVKQKDEDDNAYIERMRLAFRQFMNIMWVSGDTRDIGDFDKTMLLSCRFNNDNCNEEHFSLIQNSRYWNCYTLDAANLSGFTARGGKGDELDIVAFTDNYDATHIGKFNFNEAMALNLLNTSDKDLLLNVPFWCVNEILNSKMFEPSGFRVFIHERKNYPLFSKDFLNVQPGKSSKIILRPIRSRLISTASHLCTQPPHEPVRYVRYFSFGSQDVTTREYDKTEKDFIAEAKQQFVYEGCGCYSHRYPFQVNNSKLCYYLPPENWKSPTAAFWRKIKCHDEFIQKAGIGKLAQKFLEKRSCQFTRYRPWLTTISWPKYEDIEDIWDDLIAPLVESGKEFTLNDGHRHHIYNFTGWSVLATRQELMYLHLLLTEKDCLRSELQAVNKTGQPLFDSLIELKSVRKIFMHNGECVNKQNLIKNMLRIRVSLLSTLADAYEEQYSYELTEALSETGGIFGLWLGVSLLVVFELIDFLYVLTTACWRNRPHEY